MTLVDLKGHLMARAANLGAQLQEARKTVAILEADLAKARREADTALGALRATEQVLADMDAAVISPAAREASAAAPQKP